MLSDDLLIPIMIIAVIGIILVAVLAYVLVGKYAEHAMRKL